jgi:hypothetical protein
MWAAEWLCSILLACHDLISAAAAAAAAAGVH